MAPRVPQGDLVSSWRTGKAGRALKAKRRRRRSLRVTEHLLQAWLMQWELFQRLGSPQELWWHQGQLPTGAGESPPGGRG